MITKYSIDLRQFNDGESDKITFPTFDQCVMYGIHKLKKACEGGNCVVPAILICDSLGRKIVVNPSAQEVDLLPSFGANIERAIRLELKRDPLDGDGQFLF